MQVEELRSRHKLYVMTRFGPCMIFRSRQGIEGKRNFMSRQDFLVATEKVKAAGEARSRHKFYVATSV